MSPALIIQVIAQFGPPALDLLKDLFSVGSKDMTPEEIIAFCVRHKKSYDTYRAEGPQKQP